SGVMSLFKSWHEARTAANEPARRASFWILVSQLGGGVLAILVLPLLHFVGVPPLWSTVFAGLAYGFALTMPLAFFRWGARNDRRAPSPSRSDPAGRPPPARSRPRGAAGRLRRPGS